MPSFTVLDLKRGVGRLNDCLVQRLEPYWSLIGHLLVTYWSLIALFLHFFSNRGIFAPIVQAKSFDVVSHDPLSSPFSKFPPRRLGITLGSLGLPRAAQDCM